MDYPQLNYRCRTSVAPQHLITATVTIHHNDLSEDEDEGDMYEVLPHLLVVNGSKDGKESYCTAMSDDNHNSYVSKIKPAQCAGVALEPIVDGNLAKQNPQSTAKTAIAVGGVVSIAVPEGADEYDFLLGKTVIFKESLQECYAKHKKRLVFVPTTTDESIQKILSGASASRLKPENVIGTVVDNSQIRDEGYIRVKLF